MKSNNYNIEKIIDSLYNKGYTNFLNQKDLALVKAQMRSAIIIFAVVIFMLVAGQDTSFVIMYANIIFMMFGLSTISYDAFDNGEAFVL